MIWTDDELDAMAIPTDADIERAEELSQTDRLVKWLWLAGLVGVIVWNQKKFRYERNGQAITRHSIRQAMEAVRKVGRTRILALAAQLQSKSVTLPFFQIAARDQIKAMHTLATAIAQGGKGQLSAIELTRIGAQTRKEYAYFQAMMLQLGSGQQPMDGRFMQRLQMYINASRKSFSEAERRMFDNAGFDEEENILGGSEHCEECIDQTALGRVPIGTLTELGERICLSNDMCDIVFFRSSDGATNFDRLNSGLAPDVGQDFGAIA